MGRRQLQEAKNRGSRKIVRKAQEQGLRAITLRDNDAVVVVAVDEYEKLKKPRHGKLAGFFRRSPLAAMELDVTRRRDVGRKIDMTCSRGSMHGLAPLELKRRCNA